MISTVDIALAAGNAVQLAALIAVARRYRAEMRIMSADVRFTLSEMVDALKQGMAEVERLAADNKALRADLDHAKARLAGRSTAWGDQSPFAAFLRHNPMGLTKGLGRGPFVNKHPQSSAAASRADTPAAHSGPARARPGFKANGDAA